VSYAEEKFYAEAELSQAGCIIVGSGDWPLKTVIIAANPKLAFARAAAWLLAEADDEAGIHPSATIAPDAKIGDRVRIGPGVVIESGAVIGSGAFIEAGCYIGKSSNVSNDFRFFPRLWMFWDV